MTIEERMETRRQIAASMANAAVACVQRIRLNPRFIRALRQALAPRTNQKRKRRALRLS